MKNWLTDIDIQRSAGAKLPHIQTKQGQISILNVLLYSEMGLKEMEIWRDFDLIWIDWGQMVFKELINGYDGYYIILKFSVDRTSQMS